MELKQKLLLGGLALTSTLGVLGFAFSIPALCKTNETVVGDTAYSSTIISSQNGHVEVNVGSAVIGEEVTFTVVPDDGYECVSFKIDGEEKTLTDNKYTTTMKKNGFVVNAKFAKSYYFYYKDLTPIPGDDSSTDYFDGDYGALVDKYYSVDTKGTADISDDEVTMWTGFETKTINSRTVYVCKTSTIPLSVNGVYPTSVIGTSGIAESLGIVNNAIKWRYVSESEGKIQFVSQYAFGGSTYNNGGYVRYNNSRARLTLDGYASEIWASDTDKPAATTVDNSAATTDSDTSAFTCENTNDVLYLLSYKDYTNPAYGFSSSTDPAQNRITYNLSSGEACENWTRTVDSRDSSGGVSWVVSPDGNLHGAYSGHTMALRPACVMSFSN